MKKGIAYRLDWKNAQLKKIRSDVMGYINKTLGVIEEIDSKITKAGYECEVYWEDTDIKFQIESITCFYLTELEDQKSFEEVFTFNEFDWGYDNSPWDYERVKANYSKFKKVYNECLSIV